MRGRNFYLAFFLLIFSGFASASTVTYWYLHPAWTANFRGPTALSACQSYNPNANATYRVSGGYCYRTIWGSESFVGNVISATETCQFGNTGLVCNASCNSPNTMVNGQCVMPSCPVGQKRNSGGQCEAVTCPGVSDGHTGPSEPSVWSPEQNACVKYYALKDAESCQYSGQQGQSTSGTHTVVTNDPSSMTKATDEGSKCGFDVKTQDCKTRADGLHVCTVTGTYNGQYNPNGTKDNIYNCPDSGCTQKPEPPVYDKPQPETSTESKPCNYTSVNGALECTSSQVTDKEGTKNCGTVSGVWQCIKSPPSQNGISVLTKVTTETMADASTKTTKTDQATQKKCVDINQCTLKTTTTVTVTVKDGNGNVTSTTGSCKGDNCPDSNGNPDADGDGFGDCVDDCGDEGEGSATASNDCEVPPACDGDPFQCAILNQSFINSCAERAVPTSDEKTAANADIDAEYSKLDQAQAELDSKVTAAFGDFKAAASGNTRPGTGDCLPDKQFIFLGKTLTLPFSDVCPFLELLRQALLAIAYLAAARILNKAI